MYKLASILLHDDDESKDIVQDVFARLLVGELQLQEVTAPTFLLSCVRNKCLNVIRDRNIHERARQLLMLESEVTSKPAEDIEAEVSALYQAVANLFPPVCREVILLRYRDRLTCREIAERLCVSETTVYKHLHSALDQLREILKSTER